MKQAVAYIRTSKAKEEENASYDTQLNEIKAYAHKQGFHICSVFYDNGVSGTSVYREQLNALKDHCKANSIDTMFVWKWDRFSRDIYAKAMLIHDLGKANISCVSTEGFNGEDATDKLMQGMLDLIASFEHRKIAERMYKGKQASALKGKSVGGRKAYGFKDEHEKKIVLDIFKLKDKGFGLTDIANKLNDMNIRTRSGGLWDAKRISNILSKEETLYKGKRVSIVNGKKCIQQVESIL